MKACIERIVSNQLGGWALNDNDCAERLLVTLLLDGQIVATTRADIYREDLARNRVGDGYYGYIFTNLSVPNLPAAYLDGRIDVTASGDAASRVFAKPAYYLRQHLQFATALHRLESSTFIDFLSSISFSDSLNTESAGQLLDLMNAGRAHF